MNNNYTRITYQNMLDDFMIRLKNDERFKNMSSATIFQLFIEMLSSTMDMTNYYMQRTSEEAFIDTARLDSSIIKHGKNLGYNPVRNTPAQAEIAIIIRGPLPNNIQENSTIYFSQDETNLVFNNYKYKLNCDYSYTFTKQDIIDGKSSTWSKTLIYSVPNDSMNYYTIQGEKLYNTTTIAPIKIFQGELKTHIIRGIDNPSKIGKSYQFYDIDDLKFSDWFGQRDPNGWYNDIFYPNKSWTKVGIGNNQDDAFNSKNLFEIEDNSIYLNKKLINFARDGESLNVCSLTTNSDKTVRLKFGDGYTVTNGLNKESENIYIQYISCDGDLVNKVGSKGCELKYNNKFYAMSSNGVIDITSNIKILLNTDINGGEAFESTQSIKNKAPLYFASNNRLITKQDFISYLKTINNPIKVQNAIAWGQDEIESFDTAGDVTYKYLQNIICYCIVASLYNTTSSVHDVINVLSDNTTNINGTFSVYGTSNDYINHLSDYIKMLFDYDNFYSTQYNANPSSQWIKNIKLIRNNIEPNMILNTKLFSLPPIVQYYDVVGTVKVQSLTKLQEYKRNIENEIYQWLDDNCNFNTKIYKSDIIKFFNKNENTKSVDLDIRVSDIIKSKDISYLFDIANKSVDTYFAFNSNLPGSNISNSNYKFNTITIPNSDNKSNQLNANMFINKNVNLKIIDLNNNNVILNIKFVPYSVTESDSNITLSTYGVFNYPSNLTFKNNYILSISMPSNTDFVSLSTFSTSNYNAYNLTTDDIQNIYNFLCNWIKDSETVKTANRAIPLPYYVSSLDNNTREETIMRKGIVQSTYQAQLTEKSFWMYAIPFIIKNYYNLDGDYNKNNEIWNYIDKLIYDVYTSFKATLADSLLDDNNNIVNYSMDNELAVVRLNIDYKLDV